MPKRALTDPTIEKLKAPASGQVDYFDKGYPGLALRVSYGGRRTWVFFHRYSGKLRRMTLGALPAMRLGEAREQWRLAREAVQKGTDPAVARAEAAGDTFDSVMTDWLKRDQSGNRSHDEVKRSLDKAVPDSWKTRPIGEIKRPDILKVTDAIADRGAVIHARRVHAYLHRLFRWSVGRGLIEVNPMADLPKPGSEISRDRVLTDDELKAVWKAAGEIGWPFGPAIKLLMLTGARREEIGQLRWSEIDPEGKQIQLEGARTKNGAPHIIPLSQSALDIIEKLPAIDESDLVFTSTGETAVSGWSKAKARLDERTKIKTPWRIHDLRRTVATGLQKLGIGLQVVEAILAHVSGSRAGVIGIYQRHSFADEKRAALDAWARHVESLLTGTSSNVVVMKRPA